jgi:hypothetical protein
MPSPTSPPPSIRMFERGWLSSNNVLLTGRDAACLVDMDMRRTPPRSC